MRSARAVLLLIACGCHGDRSGQGATIDTAAFATAAPAAAGDSALRIVVTGDPHVYVNGRMVSLARLDSLLAGLQAVNGEVWFYIERPDPTVAAAHTALVDSVLNDVSRHELPLRASHRPDFSDVVGKRKVAGPEAGPP